MGTTVALSGQQALDSLDPKARLAIELYVNPMYSETFGNLSRSAAVAGLGTTKPIRTPEAKAAIAYLHSMRDEQSQKVAEVLSRYSMDAAHRLIAMLGADTVDGEPLKVLDPSKLLEKPPVPIMRTNKDGEEYVAGYDNGHIQQAKGMTDHNKAVASLIREARTTVSLILAYHLGPPGQQRGEDATPGDPLDLGSLTTEQLRELGRHVEEVKTQREGAAPVVEAEFSLEEEAKEEATPPARKVAPKPRKQGLPF